MVGKSNQLENQKKSAIKIIKQYHVLRLASGHGLFYTWDIFQNVVAKAWTNNSKVRFDKKIKRPKMLILNGPLLDTFIAKMNFVPKFGKKRATDHVMELSSKLEVADWSFIVKKLLS